MWSGCSYGSEGLVCCLLWEMEPFSFCPLTQVPRRRSREKDPGPTSHLFPDTPSVRSMEDRGMEGRASKQETGCQQRQTEGPPGGQTSFLRGHLSTLLWVYIRKTHRIHAAPISAPLQALPTAWSTSASPSHLKIHTPPFVIHAISGTQLY